MAKRHRARTGRLGRSFMNADDFRFLDELYYATNGSAWDNSVGWDRRHEHPLGCTGVTAAAASGEEGKGDEAIHRLSGLDLRGNNLRWVTNFPVLSPAERGVLAVLQRASGRAKAKPPIRPDGHIPDSIGGCHALVTLDLRRNRLRGLIPSAIGGLVNLKHLNLYANSLTGPIPESIGNLERLVELRLNCNQLTGPIPHTIGNCARLVRLYLASNCLHGPLPRGLCLLVRLESLDLRNNNFSGPIPHEIGDLVLLKEVGLSGNSALEVPYEVQPKHRVSKAMQKALQAHMYMDKGDDDPANKREEEKKLDIDDADAVTTYYGEILRYERFKPSRLCSIS